MQRVSPSVLASLLTVILVGGCALPYPIVSSSSKPAPGVTRHLPSDLPANEVLVLAQFSKTMHFDHRRQARHQTDIRAFLVRTSELASLGGKVKLETVSTGGIGMLMILPPEGGGASTEKLTEQTVSSLRLLCVIASDARTFRFSPDGDDGYDVQTGTLTQSDRHSFTRGLREFDAFKPSEISGPCGIKGFPAVHEWGWTQVIDFLGRVPVP